MIEFILSKTILIVFSLAVLIASGTMVSSFYEEQEAQGTVVSFQQIVDILYQADSFGGEFKIKLVMSHYLEAESVLRIGNGSLFLQNKMHVFSATFACDFPIKILDGEGIEVMVLEVVRGDILVIERHWDGDVLRTVVYIENVDATFSTALTNRSASSMVL